jgi:Hypothetical glycosyl hydrolase family 15
LSFPSIGRRVRWLVVTALFSALALAAVPAARAAAGDTGRVHLMQSAESDFDVFTRNPGADQRQWMRDHYARMKTWAPYFDSRLDWYPNAWAYRDAYAIYKSDSRVSAHPDWILKDVSGNRLYIPWGCSGGTCPQYAADIGNPAFRAAWIADARSSLAQGYKGLYIDDVNMQWRVGDGAGRSTKAIDPRTGQAMTDAAWQRYMADFMEQVRAALPGKEIVHNAIWYSGDTPDIRRQLRAADVVGLERGFNDSGLTNGTGRWSFRAFADLIDRAHADGHEVLLDTSVDSSAERMYGLATYLLVSNGKDLLGNGAATRPDGYWKGYDVQLGDALGKRYLQAGVWRRDFERGTVLVNEPGEPRRSVSFSSSLRDIGGEKHASVTLGPAAGAVLLRDGLDPTPAAGSPPAAAPHAPSVVREPVPTAAGTRPGSVARHARVTLRVRARRAARGLVLVSGTVRGARSGRVLVTARSARRSTRAVLRLRSGGKFAKRLRMRGGRWRLRAEYRATSRGPVLATAARALSF